MIFYKTYDEIEQMRAAALVVSRTLGMLAAEIKPGVSPLFLDKLAEEYIRSQGAEPGFLGLYGFPNTLCMSPNAQVVHGIPTDEPLREGDIISVDCGAKLDGFFGDHAYTFAVGQIDEDKQLLLQRTKHSLYLGIAQMRAGNRLGDIGHAIQSYCESFGYGVVREMVGHGIGRKMHEEPQVPNYGRRGSGKRLNEGLVLAVEPMINMGRKGIVQLADGWTVLTVDRKPSAHFEHDVAIVHGKPEILSSFDFIYQAQGLDLRTADELQAAIDYTNAATPQQ